MVWFWKGRRAFSPSELVCMEEKNNTKMEIKTGGDICCNELACSCVPLVCCAKNGGTNETSYNFH